MTTVLLERLGPGPDDMERIKADGALAICPSLRPDFSKGGLMSIVTAVIASDPCLPQLDEEAFQAGRIFAPRPRQCLP